MRLDKLLGSQTDLSRKEARQVIKDGLVQVGDEVIRDPGFSVDPSAQSVTVAGTPLDFKEHLYLMLNKPAGYISATEDRSQKTVLDLVPPELYRDGVLVAGDAAGFVVNLGFTVRGMDFAIESGRLAAETVIKAHEMQDYSAKMLSAYEKALEDSFVLRDMRAYKGFPALTANRMIYKNVPQTAEEIVTKLFTVDGKQDPDLVSGVLESVTGMASPAQLLGLAGTALESL